MPVKYDEYYSAQDHALGPVVLAIFPTRTLGNPKAHKLNIVKPTVYGAINEDKKWKLIF